MISLETTTGAVKDGMLRSAPAQHLRRGSAAMPQEVRSAIKLGCVAMILMTLVAVIVGLGMAAAVRHELSYPFPHGTLGWAGVKTILLDNLRLALAPVGASLLLSSTRPDEGAAWSRFSRAMRAVCDLVIGGAAIVNLLLVGASYGAYGMKMARYTLPYAPVELAGFACALTMYLSTRRRALRLRNASWLIAATVVLLSIAALLEGLLPAL